MIRVTSNAAELTLGKNHVRGMDVISTVTVRSRNKRLQDIGGAFFIGIVLPKDWYFTLSCLTNSNNFRLHGPYKYYSLVLKRLTMPKFEVENKINAPGKIF